MAKRLWGIKPGRTYLFGIEATVTDIIDGGSAVILRSPVGQDMSFHMTLPVESVVSVKEVVPEVQPGDVWEDDVL